MTLQRKYSQGLARAQDNFVHDNCCDSARCLLANLEHFAANQTRCSEGFSSTVYCGHITIQPYARSSQALKRRPRIAAVHFVMSTRTWYIPGLATPYDTALAEPPRPSARSAQVCQNELDKQPMQSILKGSNAKSAAGMALAAEIPKLSG